MKKITLLLLTIFCCWQISAQTGTVIIGIDDGTPNTATGNACPLQDTNKTQRIQFLYTASELSSAGLIAGNITSIGWVVTALNGSGLQENYSISMKSTTSTVLTATFETGATVVYNPSDFTPTATGNVIFNLSTPFLWDGTSNIIVEVCAGSASGTATQNVSCANSTIGNNKTTAYRNNNATSPCTVASGNALGQRPLLVVTGNVASCLAPTNIVSGSVTSTSVSISWDAAVPTPAVGYQYVVSTSNVAPTGAGTNTTTTFATVSSLTPQTTYYVFVRSVCSGTENSAWSSSVSFTTACGALTTLPHSESFNTAALPSCWTTALITGTTNWAPTTSNDGVPAPRTGNRFAGKSWVGNDDALLISPAYNLSAYPTNQTRLNVWIYRSEDGEATDRTTFYANTSNNLTGATMLVDVPLPITASPTVASAGWYNYIVDVPLSFNTIGNFYIIAEGRTSSSFTSYGIGFDDYKFELSPLCPDQTGLTVGGISSTGANTSWDALTGNIGYQYAVTTSATPPASGTDTTNTFAIISGLTPQTLYYLHVRSACTGSTFGNWSTISFTTACTAIITLPHSESFNLAALPSCWTTSLVTGTTNWAPTTSNDGVPAPRTGNRFAGKEWSGANDDALLISPPYNLAAYPTNQTRLNVWIYRNDVGETTDRTTFYANTTNSLAGATMLVDVPLPISAAPVVPTVGWYNYIVNVPLSFNTVGDFYIIAEGRTTSNFSSYSVGFDDYKFELAPLCPDQTGLTVAAITATGASTSWDSLTGNSGYEYAVTTSATPPATGTATTNTFAVISSLTPQTVYYLHVRAACSGSTFGTWSTISFTTSCVAQDVPYSQNFQSSPAPNLPACTSIENVGTGNVWETVNNPGNGFTTRTLSYSYDFENAANVWFYTKGLNLVAGTNYKISYDYGTSFGSLYSEKLKVAYGNSASASAMTNILADYPNLVNETALNAIVNFTPATSGVYYFGFNAYSDANKDVLYVDNIMIDVALANDSFISDNFSVYPNPVKDILNINYSENITKIQVVNMLGQEVLTKSVNNTQNQIDMSGLIQGTYLVKVTANDLVKTIKVIKQ